MCANIKRTWESLQQCVQKLLSIDDEAVFENRGTTLMSKPEYIAHYQTVFAYCTKSSSDISTVELRSSHATATVHGKELYERLRSFLISHASSLKQKLNQYEQSVLLDKYRHYWGLYNCACKVLNNIFSYLNKHCVPRAREAQLLNYFEVNTLMLFLWREHLFLPLQSKLVDAVLQLINDDRSGIAVKSTVIHTYTDSLVAMGLDDREHEHSNVPGLPFEPHTNLNLYVKYFERPLIFSTKEYYEKEVSKFRASNVSIADYAKQALERVEQEEDRLERYMHVSSKEKLNQVCHSVMIQSQLKLFHNEIEPLLADNKEEDLNRVYNLLRRVKNALEPLATNLQKHIEERGLAAIAACGTIGSGSNDARKYVKAIISVHAEFSKQIQRAFDSEPLFVAAMDKAFKKFVNENNVTKEFGTRGNVRSPELLAKYIDSILKKNSKAEDTVDLDSQFPKLMIVFKYLEDKDVFEKFYKKNLAKRLVQHQSVSDDAESNFLEHLKTQSGHDYVAKLQKMFNDVGTSRSLNETFSSYLVDKGSPLELNFTVQVLTINTWPFTQTLPSIRLPPALASCIDAFNGFYKSKHQGRKLTWLHDKSKGEIKSLYLKKAYTFVANTIQITVLLQFNDAAHLTLKDFLSRTEIPQERLLPQIETMKKMRILKKTDDGKYFLNTKYTYKSLKIKIDQVIKSEQKVENDTTHKAAQDERKFAIQACIVRVMKARNVMSMNDLMKEVIEQLQKRFNPQPAIIKKMIEVLLDREYMRRAEGNRQIFHYIA
eukprot:m.20735 g.20735  ORF g.20735 m.20735 type:complete len:771 (+) comp5280_c0_seq1:227-2539(+)